MDHSELIPGELYWLCPEPDSGYKCMIVDLSKPPNKQFPRITFCDTRHPILYTSTDIDFLKFVGVNVDGEPLVLGVELQLINWIRKLSDGPFKPNSW